MAPYRSPLPHFVYFLRLSGRNRFRRMIGQLRSPRYAIAMLFGVAYFGAIIWPWLFDSEFSGVSRGNPVIEAAAPVVMALFASWWWLWGGHAESLALTPAQVQMLVPAPIRRADLIRFRLLQTQLSIIPAAAALAYVFATAPVPFPLRALSTWMLLTTLHLHQSSASLVHASALNQGSAGLKRNRIAIAVFAVGFAALAWTLFSAGLELRAAESIEELVSGVRAAFERPLARAVFLPFTIVLAPMFAENIGEWGRAAGPALALLVLHYVWVIRTDTAFEESAAAAGRKRAERRDAIRSGRHAKLGNAQIRGDRAALFPLHATGRPATALVWKNTVSFSRQMQVASPLLLVLVLVVLYVALVILTGEPRTSADAVGMILVASGSMLTPFGPMGIRNDLRDDMSRLDVLRSYPLTPSAIVAAEVAASTICLTVLQLLLIAGGIVWLAFGEMAVGHFSWILYGYAAAIVVMPAVNGVAMAIQNASVLLFPGWVRSSRTYSGGVEVIGQQMLTMSITMALLLVALLVPVVAAGGVLLRLGLGLIPGIIAVVAALVTLWSELVLAITLLGEVFETTDTSQLTA